MGLRLLEGFETSSNATIWGRIWEGLVGAPNSIFLSGAINRAGNAIQSGSGFIATTKPLTATPQGTMIVGFAFRSANGSNTIEGASPSFNKPGMALRNDDGEQIRLEFFNDSANGTKPGGYYYRIRAVRGVTTIATTNEKWRIRDSDEGWIVFEWKAVIHDTTGSVELRYWDPKSKLGIQTATWDAAVTNVDTQNQATAGANRIQIIADSDNPANEVAWDDIHVLDAAGAKNNDFIGPVVVVRQTLSGDGATVDWDLRDATSTDDAWDEVNNPDDDGRLVSDVVGAVHLAAMTAQTYIRTVPVVGVRLDHCANRQSAAGSITLHFRWRKTTGTPAETDGDNYVVDSSSWRGEFDVREDDPNTGTGFVIADLDAIQVGVRNGG